MKRHLLRLLIFLILRRTGRYILAFLVLGFVASALYYPLIMLFAALGLFIIVIGITLKKSRTRIVGRIKHDRIGL